MLTLKEYRDGTVSGKLSIPSSSAVEPYSCGSIGGRADDRRIIFYLTSLGDSYLSAKMAVAGNSAGTTIAYRGHISGNRRYLSGKWHAANDYRSYLRGGSFSFNLTHINGRAVTRKNGNQEKRYRKPAHRKGRNSNFQRRIRGRWQHAHRLYGGVALRNNKTCSNNNFRTNYINSYDENNLLSHSDPAPAGNILSCLMQKG